MIHARPDYNKRIQDADGLIADEEPVFLLRAQDRFAPCLLQTWCCLYEAVPDHDPEMLALAEKHISLMREWQQDVACKTPDLPSDPSLAEK